MAGRRRRALDAVKWTLLVGVPLFVLVAAWQGYHVYVVAKHLTTAQSTLQTAQDAISARDVTKAKAELAKAGVDTKQAADAANDPLWSLLNHVPFLGGTLATAQTVTRSADQIARVILPPALEAATDLDGKHLRKPDGSIDYQRIANTEPALRKAAVAMHQEVARVTRTHSRVGYLQDKRTKFLDQITKLDTQLTKAQEAASNLPAMLGAEGTRRYFVGFLTNAEARSTGGFLGAYGILRADHGHLSFERFGTNADLKPAAKPVVDLGNQFSLNYDYARTAQTWTESTIDPHYPEVGAIWVGLWKAQTGEQLDGAIATDPSGLSHLLAVTGPVLTTSGDIVTADNVVPLVENLAYSKFGDANQMGRKLFLLDVASHVSHALLSQGGDAGGLVDALKGAARDHRIRVFASRKVEQQLILDTPVSGELPKRGRPLAYLVLNNAAANKMEYYLQRAVTYIPTHCGKPAEIKITLTNTLTDPAGLPMTVVSHIPAIKDTPLGSVVDIATLYINGVANYHGMQLDGVDVGPRASIEHGLTALSWFVTVRPGATAVTRVFVDSDRAGSTPRIVSQPLVIPEIDSVLPPPPCEKTKKLARTTERGAS